jgi:hypothetical protein
MIVVGIDPGKNGAFCTMDTTRKILSLHVMPTVNQKVYNLKEVSNLFQTLGMRADHVFIEKVSAIQGASSKAAFNFGYGFGLLEGMLAALKIPYSFARPKEWQAYAHKNIEGKNAKGKSLLAAQMRFPDNDFLATPRSKKPHDGLIDAALIAEYGLTKLVHN